MNNPTVEQVRALPKTNEKIIPTEFLDEMGHMNVAYYIQIFDRAAWKVFDLFGMDLKNIDVSTQGVFALEQHIRYLAEVRVGQAVSIHSRLLGRGRKTLHFMHFMVNDTTDTLSATFEALGANMDMSERRTAVWQDTIAARVDEVLATHQAIGWDAPLSGSIQAR